MFLPLTDDPVPYVLLYEREKKRENPTVWWLRPQNAETTTAYRARWNDIGSNKTLAADARAVAQTKIDREALSGALAKAETVYAVGDTIDDVAALCTVISKLDNATLQELIWASQNMSVLEEGRKNS